MSGKKKKKTTETINNKTGIWHIIALFGNYGTLPVYEHLKEHKGLQIKYNKLTCTTVTIESNFSPEDGPCRI